MVSIEQIKTKIIDKVKASKDQAFLETIDRLLGSEKEQEIVDLTKAQEAMLQMSENDIQLGKLITEKELDELDKQWNY